MKIIRERTAAIPEGIREKFLNEIHRMYSDLDINWKMAENVRYSSCSLRSAVSE